MKPKLFISFLIFILFGLATPNRGGTSVSVGDPSGLG